jgi:hypothetical protein
MNIFRAYFSGLRKAAGLPRPVFVIYFVNLLLALLIVFPLYSITNAKIGASLNVNDLLQQFHWPVFSDFFRNNIGAVKAVLAQVKWILLIYWLLSVFFAGGIIRTLNEDRFSMAAFFHGAGFNFFRFLGISIIVLLLHALVILIIYIPAFFIISKGEFGNEVPIVITVGIAFALHAFLLVWLFAVNDYSRFYAVLHNKNSLKAFAGGFRYVIKKFGKAYFLYLFLLILPAASVYGYFRADAEIGTRTRNGLIAVFFVQQAFIILRIWFRIWIFASPLKMYKRDFEKQSAVTVKESSPIIPDSSKTQNTEEPDK